MPDGTNKPSNPHVAGDKARMLRGTKPAGRGRQSPHVAGDKARMLQGTKPAGKGIEKKIKKAEKARLKVLNKPINTITARALADEKVFPIIKAFRGQGYTYDKIAIALNKEGYKTRRGCEWSRPQVFRICQRNGL